MSYQPVTDGQFRCAKKMAIEKGIGLRRFQEELDSGGFARYLESLRGSILPPQDARIHFFPGIEVFLDQSWDDAVNVAGPNTPMRDDVRKIGDQYPPTGKGKVVRDYIAINFPQGDGWQVALDWAKGQKLQKTTPREVFAVSTQHPKLHVTLGQNPMYMVSTVEAGRPSCCVWWSDAGRVAGLSWESSFYRRYIWFLFRNPSVLVA